MSRLQIHIILISDILSLAQSACTGYQTKLLTVRYFTSFPDAVECITFLTYITVYSRLEASTTRVSDCRISFDCVPSAVLQSLSFVV